MTRRRDQEALAPFMDAIKSLRFMAFGSSFVVLIFGGGVGLLIPRPWNTIYLSSALLLLGSTFAAAVAIFKSGRALWWFCVVVSSFLSIFFAGLIATIPIFIKGILVMKLILVAYFGLSIVTAWRFYGGISFADKLKQIINAKRIDVDQGVFSPFLAVSQKQPSKADKRITLALLSLYPILMGVGAYFSQQLGKADGGLRLCGMHLLALRWRL